MADQFDVLNFIDGKWERAEGDTYAVINPASGETIANTPLSAANVVERATAGAKRALADWRRTPAGERIQYLFKLKAALEANYEDIARTITLEAGKTIGESRGELLRGIENVEVACGIPAMMQGYNSEDIASGIDEMMIRQPVGVTAAITPFNFPGMIPFWFLPYAIACGNTFILKPSERVPLTMQKVGALLEEIKLPAGVIQIVNGGKDVVNAILDAPDIRAVSFVGSTKIAQYVYSRATANGKRAQCQGGAKNPIVILPDADMDSTTRIAADSAFGCAGQRCLAASVAITVGAAKGPFSEAIAEAARNRSIGMGLDEATDMGPVISAESQARIEALIEKGIADGAKPLVDGRNVNVSGYDGGYFLKPTVLGDVNPTSELAKTEVFGPVLSMMHADSIDDAIQLVNDRAYGNMACLFTSSGSAARKFRYEADAGNIGINLGVAAPMAFFPFSGWGDSFFGTLHAQGSDAIEFYTQKKVVVERWPKEWSRKF
jgi:malonate-semialdehyde dehydrogenase (acetylating) / methylmalonate-semialdehyde dehydrogenase